MKSHKWCLGRIECTQTITLPNGGKNTVPEGPSARVEHIRIMKKGKQQWKNKATNKKTVTTTK